MLTADEVRRVALEAALDSPVKTRAIRVGWEGKVLADVTIPDAELHEPYSLDVDAFVHGGGRRPLPLFAILLFGGVAGAVGGHILGAVVGL